MYIYIYNLGFESLRRKGRFCEGPAGTLRTVGVDFDATCNIIRASARKQNQESSLLNSSMHRQIISLGVGMAVYPCRQKGPTGRYCNAKSTEELAKAARANDPESACSPPSHSLCIHTYKSVYIHIYIHMCAECTYYIYIHMVHTSYIYTHSTYTYTRTYTYTHIHTHVYYPDRSQECQ